MVAAPELPWPNHFFLLQHSIFSFPLQSPHSNASHLCSLKSNPPQPSAFSGLQCWTGVLELSIGIEHWNGVMDWSTGGHNCERSEPVWSCHLRFVGYCIYAPKCAKIYLLEATWYSKRMHVHSTVQCTKMNGVRMLKIW